VNTELVYTPYDFPFQDPNRWLKDLFHLPSLDSLLISRAHKTKEKVTCFSSSIYTHCVCLSFFFNSFSMYAVFQESCKQHNLEFK